LFRLYYHLLQNADFIVHSRTHRIDSESAILEYTALFYKTIKAIFSMIGLSATGWHQKMVSCISRVRKRGYIQFRVQVPLQNQQVFVVPVISRFFSVNLMAVS